MIKKVYKKNTNKNTHLVSMNWKLYIKQKNQLFQNSLLGCVFIQLQYIQSTVNDILYTDSERENLQDWESSPSVLLN